MNSTPVNAIPIRPIHIDPFAIDPLATESAESRTRVLLRQPCWSGFSTFAAGQIRFFLHAVWRPFIGRVRSQRKKLTVCDTTSLGDRRFVSILQVERQRFLIGYSPSTVTLLARLPDEAAKFDKSTVANEPKEKN
jgi:hypothetical protein